MNKLTKEVVEEVIGSGMTPVEYLVSVYRDEGADANLRALAARSAAPFIHAKLSSSEVTNVSGNQETGEGLTDAELMTIAAGGKIEAA